MPPTAGVRDRPRRRSAATLIVETALELLRTEGYEATSMRRVAQALDTGPASLYVYVANRDELLDLMLDRAIAELPLPEPDPARWREQLKELMHALTRLMTSRLPGPHAPRDGDHPDRSRARSRSPSRWSP